MAAARPARHLHGQVRVERPGPVVPPRHDRRGRAAVRGGYRGSRLPGGDVPRRGQHPRLRDRREDRREGGQLLRHPQRHEQRPAVHQHRGRRVRGRRGGVLGDRRRRRPRDRHDRQHQGRRRGPGHQVGGAHGGRLDRVHGRGRRHRRSDRQRLPGVEAGGPGAGAGAELRRLRLHRRRGQVHVRADHPGPLPVLRARLRRRARCPVGRPARRCGQPGRGEGVHRPRGRGHEGDRPVRQAGSISGKVTDRATGQPIFGAYANIAGMQAGGIVGSTDTDGAYTLDGLGPYAWKLSFWHPDYAGQWSGAVAERSAATTVKVRVGATTTYNLPMRKGTLVTGVVTSAPGTQQNWLLVTVLNARTHDFRSYIEVNADGTYRGWVLGPQKVHLSLEGSVDGVRGHVWWRDGKTFAGADTLAVPRTGTVTANFTFNPVAGGPPVAVLRVGGRRAHPLQRHGDELPL
ncbi:carboxypeptidase-like regulatory domain-containing protein [Luedemannella flava]